MSENDSMKVPAHIAARQKMRQEGTLPMSPIAEALAGFDTPPRISIRGSRFRLVENGVESVYKGDLDVVIVGANPHTSKVYFEGEFDPDAGEVRPACSSANGKTPDANVEDPVCGSCAQCPYNVLGSKITPQGSKSKICNDVRYMAVVPAADAHKVYALNVSVTSMKPMRQYIQELGNYGIMPEEVVTTLGFDDDASYPKLTFTRKAYLPEKAMDAIDAVLQTPEVAEATRSDVPALQLEAKTEEADAPATNVAKIEDAKAKPAAVKSKAAPKKKATKAKATKAKKEEDVDAEVEVPESELEEKLDDIFG